MLAKQVLYCLNHTYSTFCSGYFADGFRELFAWAGLCPDLSLPSSWITGVSHWCPAYILEVLVVILYYFLKYRNVLFHIVTCKAEVLFLYFAVLGFVLRASCFLYRHYTT
jgi:hypothetical protein